MAVFVTWYLWPKKQQQQISEPTFIDLQGMPELKTPPPQQEVQKARPSDKRRRVAKETAPRQTLPVAPAPKTAPARQSARVKPSAAPGRPGSTGAPAKPSEAGSSVHELLRRKPQQQAGTGGGGGGTKPQPNLAPSASRMAQLEENYRRRFADDIANGDTGFLNTDDVQLGSLLRRFEERVYGVWRYPAAAALRGDEGVVAMKITFNRAGDITKYELLNGSGKNILDEEVFRILRVIQTGGGLGKLPRSYTKDEFKLIAFFQYGNARGRLR
ncbi:MAG: TonB family protein [Geobacteraceae bacterium]|nr:TonB family protein [Geobacteraceae bacterium]